MTFTPEQDQYLKLAQTRAYYQGMKDGVTNYAYWRDGVQYVGTSGRTLTEALADIDLLEKNLLARYQPILEIKC